MFKFLYLQSCKSHLDTFTFRKLVMDLAELSVEQEHAVMLQLTSSNKPSFRFSSLPLDFGHCWVRVRDRKSYLVEHASQQEVQELVAGGKMATTSELIKRWVDKFSSLF